MTDDDKKLVGTVIEEVRLLRRALEQFASGEHESDELAEKFALYRDRVLARRARKSKPEEK